MSRSVTDDAEDTLSNKVIKCHWGGVDTYNITTYHHPTRAGIDC